MEQRNTHFWYQDSETSKKGRAEILLVQTFHNADVQLNCDPARLFGYLFTPTTLLRSHTSNYLRHGVSTYGDDSFSLTMAINRRARDQNCSSESVTDDRYGKRFSMIFYTRGGMRRRRPIKDEKSRIKEWFPETETLLILIIRLITVCGRHCWEQQLTYRNSACQALVRDISLLLDGTKARLSGSVLRPEVGADTTDDTSAWARALVERLTIGFFSYEAKWQEREGIGNQYNSLCARYRMQKKRSSKNPNIPQLSKTLSSGCFSDGQKWNGNNYFVARRS